MESYVHLSTGECLPSVVWLSSAFLISSRDAWISGFSVFLPSYLSLLPLPELDMVLVDPKHHLFLLQRQITTQIKRARITTATATCTPPCHAACHPAIPEHTTALEDHLGNLPAPQGVGAQYSSQKGSQDTGIAAMGTHTTSLAPQPGSPRVHSLGFAWL